MATEGWHALIIGTWQYENSQFETLRSPERDIAAVRDVLSASHVGGYQVEEPLVNVGYGEAREAVGRFFHGRTPNESCLVYISGHGMRNQDGSFYFAMSNTDPENDASRRTTALEGELLLREMRDCRAGTIVALLDCCYSGTILPQLRETPQLHLPRLKGTKGSSTGQRQTRGRAILTATGAGEPAAQEAAGGRLSLWTEGIVDGLGTGKAAGDGMITVDDLHRYAYEWVQRRRPQQHPHKWVAAGASILLALDPRAAPSVPPQVQPPPVPRAPDLRPLPEPARILEPPERTGQLEPTLEKLNRLVDVDGSGPARRLRDYLAAELAGYRERDDSEPRDDSEQRDDREHRYERVVQDLSTYLDANPDGTYGGVARRLRGDARRLLGAYEEALADLDASLAARPWDTVTLRLRGDVLRLLGAYEDALADLNTCLAAHPRDADALRIRGHVLRALGRYNQALRDFAESRALRPDMPRPEDRATHRISEGLQRTVDRNRDTLPRLKKILERDPRNPTALRLRARAARMVGDYDRALEDLENLPDGVSDPNTLRLRGEIRYARGQHREAVSDLNDVLKRRPDDQIATSYRDSADHARRRRQLAVSRTAADPADH